MPDRQEQINLLNQKLDLLLQRQQSFQKEIQLIKGEIKALEGAMHLEQNAGTDVKETAQTTRPSYLENYKARVEKIYGSLPQPVTDEKGPKAETSFFKKPQADIEKFIGQNLINKIGIVILIIGVAIGVKYSIDHKLISPQTRIILGYLFGIGLLIVGIRLRKNYTGFSAVLVSGAMAIMYFITYAAYSFYGLIPQALAFVLMAVFTIFTVFAAIQYNQQVIAHIGLVGAYAVPFLLSDGSGNIKVLFSYMAIINAGILFIAFKKYWKPLYYVAFALSWLIFLSWFMDSYNYDKHFAPALLFLAIFFFTFYLMFLVYKLGRRDKFDAGDIVVLLINSFIFYGLGYAILNHGKLSIDYTGLFTIINAFIHFIACVMIYRQQLADKKLFYIVAMLALAFITIAVPVQLEGSWVTLLWAAEAALLFWVGRTRDIRFYEKLSYILMFLALISIAIDWSVHYQYYGDAEVVHPFTNIYFATALFMVAAYAFINYIHYKYPIVLQEGNKWSFFPLVKLFIPALLIGIIYLAFHKEIAHYWNLKYHHTALQIKGTASNYPEVYYNEDILFFKELWLTCYSLLFVSLLIMANCLRLRSRALGIFTTVLSIVATLVFVTQTYFTLGDLRDSYLSTHVMRFFHPTGFHIHVRYLCLEFFAIMLYVTYRQLRKAYMQPVDNYVVPASQIALYGIILIVLSNELLHYTSLQGNPEGNKLGLSILWGAFSLLMVIAGIVKRKQYLRIAAIVLFAGTLVKLFFYDLVHLGTISKTIVFVSLGILLLIISFLYNKHKSKIFGDDEI